MTTTSPRAVTLAASIAWRHLTADPVRALLLGWRVLPGPLRGCLRLAGPYGRAAVLWGTGDRQAALGALERSPRLAARLAWRQGELTAAVRALDGARGPRARRLRATLAAEPCRPPPRRGPDHDRGQYEPHRDQNCPRS